MKRMRLDGVFAPLPTPFDENDRFDERRLRAAMPHWLASPLTGFVMLGTNGEAGLLSDAESAAVIATARSVVPAERPLIAGAARESTLHTIAAVKTAAQLGADAVIVRTPAYFKGQMTAAALERFYRAVADASPVPVLLYNFTAATGVNLQPEVVARLADHPNVCGIKESGSDIAQISDLVAVASPRFAVLAGSATTFQAALATGVTGGILALAGLLPEPCVRLFELMRGGQYDEARALQRRLLPLARLLSSAWGVAGLKGALALRGVDVGVPRAPLTPAPPQALDALRQALASFEEAHA